MRVMKWFKGVKDLNELRRVYRTLALKYHPDKGGDTASMQEINNEYDKLSKVLIETNTDFSEERKVYESQVSEDLKEKVAQVIILPGVTVEIIGSWIWITGDTKPVKEELKKSGFKFSRKKTAWYWHLGRYRKRTKKHYDMVDIRNMFVTHRVERDEEERRRIYNLETA